MKNLIITEEIWQEGNMYTSYCPELDVASCGRTVEEAQKNLIEVILIQLEETAKLGTLKDFLENTGYEIEVEMDELRLDKQLVTFNELAIPLGVL